MKSDRPPIVLEERPSLVVNGKPMTGTCPSCYADLDELRRNGKVGHYCFGPGTAVNQDPES